MNDTTSAQEIEQLFMAWFDASQRKDLDASMQPISDTIVSYEHSAPLEVRDIATMREECKKGFDQSSDNFRWDIPDLNIIVRGDIAVTWGLNRMAEYNGAKPTSEMWSSGTRIFQRMNSEWKLIHQHVSFPMDPESGQARMDLKP